MTKWHIFWVGNIAVFVILGFLTPGAFAELDLSNQRIISDDGNITMEFTDNIIQERRHSVNIIPNLDFGMIQLADNTIFLDDVHVNVLANSFTVKDYDQGCVIYAQNMGDNQFSIRVYTMTDSGLQKQTFNGILTPIE